MKIDLSEFYSGLCSLGLEVGYWQFEENDVPSLPYIIYYVAQKPIVYADNKAYFVSDHLVVELYTRKKDKRLESRLETFFYAQNLTPTITSEGFVDDEVYLTTYELDLI